MRVYYSPDFYKRYKKIDVRIQKSFDQRLRVFIKNPFDSSLNNHKLRDKYKGHRSIDVTGDHRAIYEEIDKGEETVCILYHNRDSQAAV